MSSVEILVDKSKLYIYLKSFIAKHYKCQNPTRILLALCISRVILNTRFFCKLQQIIDFLLLGIALKFQPFS
jgi:hypothetical protein